MSRSAALNPPEKVRRHGEVAYAAKAWPACPDTPARRVIARVEAGPQGSDTRFIITNLAGTPEHLYEDIYCARGQAENLIEAHKLHLASDRTWCTRATANQFLLMVPHRRLLADAHPARHGTETVILAQCLSKDSLIVPRMRGRCPRPARGFTPGPHKGSEDPLTPLLSWLRSSPELDIGDIR